MGWSGEPTDFSLMDGWRDGWIDDGWMMEGWIFLLQTGKLVGSIRGQRSNRITRLVKYKRYKQETQSLAKIQLML